jgi:hypothetical protein
MLMLEQCSLPHIGNSDSGKIGLAGWQRRGGVIAPRSTSDSMALVVIDSPAAALGAVVRRWLNMSKTKVVRTNTRATSALGSPAQNGELGPRQKKGANQSQAGRGPFFVNRRP